MKMKTKEELIALLNKVGLPFEFELGSYDMPEDRPNIQGFYIDSITYCAERDEYLVWGTADGSNADFEEGESYATTLDKFSDKEIDDLHYEVYCYRYAEDDYDLENGADEENS